ncbi:RNA polymerase sigma factor [Paenactinomyces guangxiensis]|uniref:RNA polymerase sigma factor n=1 Tax=Paenactinomyces guangxiensis TaxID=1490290 RepID=A0A7W2A7Q6_9BACL|nr:sigma-70 family RNA polymerase sigma factor [Paenactinomyces guangxiensis]MBA4493384.1 sigma-70 family RNA polymerase sigma factor [Paenactinomyces guangxiensis]MBH8590474.1 sigma-70 family RNA polymerase sigma factor [Paenactinomyces guangxiensis]
MQPVMDEQRLIEQAKNGDVDAYAELLKHYKYRVYYHLYHMIGNRQDAEDITQETFIKAFHRLHTYQPSRSFSAWLVKIATNTCIDELRKRNKMKTAAWEECVSNGDTPEEAILKKEQFNHYVQTLKKLPARHRSILYLRVIENFSYAQIAEALGLTHSKVRNLLYQSRIKLRTWWKEDELNEKLS